MEGTKAPIRKPGRGPRIQETVILFMYFIFLFRKGSREMPSMHSPFRHRMGCLKWRMGNGFLLEMRFRGKAGCSLPRIALAVWDLYPFS